MMSMFPSRRYESSKPSSCRTAFLVGGAEAEGNTQTQVESETGCLEDGMKRMNKNSTTVDLLYGL